jgi:hypothetical protein
MTLSTSITSRQMADRRPGFRLGIYIFKDAEIVDFAAPYGVFRSPVATTRRSMRS